MFLPIYRLSDYYELRLCCHPLHSVLFQAVRRREKVRKYFTAHSSFQRFLHYGNFVVDKVAIFLAFSLSVNCLPNHSSRVRAAIPCIRCSFIGQ